MKFGIIICSSCKRVKGVLLTNKTSKCFSCKKVIKLEKAIIVYKTNSRQELQNAIGKINAERNGKTNSWNSLFSKKQ